MGTENGYREKEVTVDMINTLVVDFFFFNFSSLKCSCKSVTECQKEHRNTYALHWGNWDIMSDYEIQKKEMQFFPSKSVFLKNERERENGRLRSKKEPGILKELK